jgi:hypothetical protein
MNTFAFSIYGVKVLVVVRKDVLDCAAQFYNNPPEVFLTLSAQENKIRFNSLVTHESTHIAQFIYEVILKQELNKMTSDSGCDEPFAYLNQLITLLISSLYETGKPDLWFFEKSENINFKLIPI